MIASRDDPYARGSPVLEALEPRILLDFARDVPWVAGVTEATVYVCGEMTSNTPNAVVDYGETAAYGMQASTESAQATDYGYYVHNVKLTGLQPNTEYHYRISHGIDQSADYTFWTAPTASDSVHFGWAADCRSDPGWHNTMAGLIAAEGPRAMVYGGDLCYTSTWPSYNQEWFMYPYYPSYTNQVNLNATTPWVNAAGNHEGWNNLTKAFTQSPEGDGATGDGFFSFDYGPCHFVIVNNMVAYGSGSAQWNWVADDLANSTAPWKFVGSHYPAYSYGSHGSDATMQQMCNQIFEPNGVDIEFAGHNHFYQHVLLDGLHHMTIGTFGVGPSSPSSGEGEIHSEATRCFGIIDATPTQLTLTTYRQDGTVIETIQKFNDPTPPSVPAGLTAEGLNESEIWLEWNASTDPESGVDHYNIYRDTQLVGTTSQTCYLDEDLDTSTTYTYEVSAVNGDMQESAKSSPAQGTTTGDVTAPKITTSWSGWDTEVEVTFSEDVDQTTAENVSNYAIDQGVSITSATRQADNETVKLITSALSPATTYTVTVNNVKDLANNPIAPDSQDTFEYDQWLNQDVGSPSPPGSMDYVDGTYTIQSNGHDIYDESDDFHFVYRTLEGDGEIVVRTVNDNNLWAAKSGAMMRKSLNGNSTEVSMVFGHQVTSAWYQTRYTTGGSTYYASAPGPINAPEYTKVIRSSGQFAGYISDDGETWTQVGDATAPGDMVSGSLYWGICACSHITGTLGTFIMDNLRIYEYGPNTAPTGVADGYNTAIGSPLNVHPDQGVLINDTDPESDDLMSILVTDVSNGTLALYANGGFGYTPNPAFTGQDTFQYKPNDGRADGNTVTVTIDVTDVPQPPVANDDSYETPKDTQLNVPAPGVLENDTDPNQDPLTAEKVSDPSNGSVLLYSDGSFTYDPTPGYTGPDSFTYKAWDGQFYSNVATVNIDVTQPAVPYYALSEETITGTVVGSLEDTKASDNVYEALTEALVGKKSILEHNWTFSVPAGDPVTFSVEAYHDGTEDDFKFQYSTNGSDWNDMVTVTKTADDDAAQTFELPGGTGGAVYVKVLDTNRANNKKDLDTVYVDELFISSYGEPVPIVTIQATDATAAEEGQDPGAFTVTRDDTSGNLTVYYAVSGSASAADYEETLSGSVTILDGQPSAGITITPVDDSDPEGSETVILTLTDDPAYDVGTPDSDTVTILDNDVVEAKDYALSETTDHGTVTGSYLDTYVSDDIYESITEVVMHPQGRASLDHTWTFNVTGGSTVTFYLEAWHSDAGADDDFVFQYSTNGTDWYDMVTVTKTADDDTYQTYGLDPSTSGTVYVKVIDTDYKKAESLDTIYVDEMYILSS